MNIGIFVVRTDDLNFKHSIVCKFLNILLFASLRRNNVLIEGVVQHQVIRL